MKGKVIIISLLLAAAVGLSGCGSNAQEAVKQKTGADAQGERRGQMARADLVGEVTSVTGSDVVVKVIEMPDFGQNTPQGNDAANSGQDKSQNRKNGSNGEGQNERQGRGQEQGPGPGREVKYTGESKTLTIPAGTAITTFDREQNGRQVKNIEVKDIKQGDTIQIWYSDKEKETIEKISVMPKRTEAPNSGSDTENKTAQ